MPSSDTRTFLVIITYLLSGSGHNLPPGFLSDQTPAWSSTSCLGDLPGPDSIVPMPPKRFGFLSRAVYASYLCLLLMAHATDWHEGAGQVDQERVVAAPSRDTEAEKPCNKLTAGSGYP